MYPVRHSQSPRPLQGKSFYISGESESLGEGLLVRLLAFFIFGMFVAGFVMRSVGWFSAAPGDLGDPRLNSYFLEHVWLWISGAKVSLWSPAFFYPFENILGFSDNHFGSVLFYALFRGLGFSREYAFDAWFVIGALLNYAACFWVLRQWQFSMIASSLGAFIFAASLPVLMADNTAQLNYRFAIPLAWFYFYQALTITDQQKRYLYLGWSCLFVAEQFLCSIYLGLLLIYSLGSLYISWWWINRNHVPDMSHVHPEQLSIYGKPIGIALMIFAILITGALLFQYHQIARQYGLTRDYTQVLSMLPKVSSYLLSDRSFISSLWSGNLGWFAQRQENQLFVGLGAMVFFCAGVFLSARSILLPKPISQLGKIAFLSIAIVWLMTIQIFGYSLYALVIQLPGVSAIRSVGRVMLVLLFPIAVLLAITVQSWQLWLVSKLGKIKPVFMVMLGWFLPALILMPESIFARHDTTLLSVWQERMQKMRVLMPKSLDADAIIFVPRQGTAPAWAGELDGMLIAQDLGYPTINGYSGSLPPGIADLAVNALTRLQAYAQWHHQPDSWIQDQLKRVVTLKNNIPWLERQGLATTWGQIILTNSENPASQIYLIEGWALPEPWGTWINGHNAQLLIPLPKDQVGTKLFHELVIQVRPLINTTHPELRVSYRVNGSKSQSVSWHWKSGPIDNILRIPIASSDLVKGYLDIQWHIDNPISPKKLGMGDDERVLGLGFESITLK
jgi:hypothetical protein